MPTNLTLGMRLLSTIYGGVAATPKSTLVNGLVSYWSLDEASGTRVDSIAASGNDLTDNNTVGSAPGMHNAAASFVTGNNEWLSLGAPINLEQYTSWTVSFWTNQPTLPDNVEIGAWANDGWVFYWTNGTTPTLYVYGNGANDTATWGSPITATAWHHILGGWDGTNIWISVDGGVPITTAHNKAPNDGAINFGIPIGATWFNGNIDEFSIWSRDLLPDERTALYNLGVGKFYNPVTEDFE